MPNHRPYERRRRGTPSAVLLLAALYATSAGAADNPAVTSADLCGALGAYGKGVFALLRKGPDAAQAVNKSLATSQSALGLRLAAPPPKLIGPDGSAHGQVDAAQWRDVEPPLRVMIWERFCLHAGHRWPEGAAYAMHYILDPRVRQAYEREVAKADRKRAAAAGGGRSAGARPGGVRPFYGCSVIADYGTHVVSQLEGFASLRAYTLRSLATFVAGLRERLSDPPLETFRSGRATAQIAPGMWVTLALTEQLDVWQSYCAATGDAFSPQQARGLEWIVSERARAAERDAYAAKLASGWTPPPPPKSAMAKRWEAREAELKGGVGPFDLRRFAYSDLQKQDVRYLDLSGSRRQRQEQLRTFLAATPLNTLHRKRLLPSVLFAPIAHPLGPTGTDGSLSKWGDKAAAKLMPRISPALALRTTAYAWPPIHGSTNPKRQDIRTISLTVAAFTVGNGRDLHLDRDVVLHAPDAGPAVVDYIEDIYRGPAGSVMLIFDYDPKGLLARVAWLR